MMNFSHNGNLQPTPMNGTKKIQELARTYPFLKGEVRSGAASVLAGRQALRVPRARCVRVGGGVGAGWAHG